MNTTLLSPKEIEQAIRNVPDFPKPGIQFKDITPVLADARLFAGTIELLTEGVEPGSVDYVVGIDARGFIFAAAAAVHLNAGFVPVRKKGKLPFDTHEEDYALDRQERELAMQYRRAPAGQRAAIKERLDELVDKHFEVRQERRLLELKRLEEELNRLREAIDRRNEARKELVGKRISELVGEENELDF